METQFRSARHLGSGRRRYTTSFDDPLKGQYSREYDVVNSTAAPRYVVHIHWGRNGVFRSCKIKKYDERFTLGAGCTAWKQHLNGLGLPLLGDESLN